ncbi:MAG: metalloregulator ArsR/SmtB family transcription factor [Acidobacteria bacterium]|nr:metalloregulator ArsR/SmtB family transcription factor [Acidobacteriota bacterium]
MPIRSSQFYEARAKIARALAHPSRLLLMDALRDREMCVCDLTELVGSDQSTVSKHLAVLKEAGLVSVRKERSMSFYASRCQCLDGFFGCLDTVLKQHIEDQRAVLVG